MQVVQHIAQLHGVVESFKRRQGCLFVQVAHQCRTWNVVHDEIPVAIFKEIIVEGRQGWMLETCEQKCLAQEAVGMHTSTRREIIFCDSLAGSAVWPVFAM